MSCSYLGATKSVHTWTQIIRSYLDDKKADHTEPHSVRNNQGIAFNQEFYANVSFSFFSKSKITRSYLGATKSVHTWTQIIRSYLDDKKADHTEPHYIRSYLDESQSVHTWTDS